MTSSLIVSLDIEKSGSGLKKHDIVAFGYTFADSLTQEILSKRTISLKPQKGNDYNFEADCYKYFWSKYPELLQKFKDNAVEITVGLQTFIDDFEKHAKNYNDIVIVTDNPAFDVGSFDYYLEEYLDHKSLHYHPHTNSYQVVMCTDSLQIGFQRKTIDKGAWASDNDTLKMMDVDPTTLCVHSHDPSDDAHHIMQMYFLICGVKK